METFLNTSYTHTKKGTWKTVPSQLPTKYHDVNLTKEVKDLDRKNENTRQQIAEKQYWLEIPLPHYALLQ